jgi:hypothetical protein
MATIEPYETKAGKRYRVRYRAPGRGQTDKRGFKTKRAAEAFAATVEVSKMRGEYVAPSLGRVTVGELTTNWLDRKRQATAPSHYRMLESAWRVHVQPRWATISVADVDQLGVEAWIAGMGRKGAGATTVIRAHGVLSGILADAVKAKRLAANPCKGIENLPRKTSKRHVYLSAEDVYRLADESGQHRALVFVLAYCGLRWGEAILLRVARRGVPASPSHGLRERSPAGRASRCLPDQGPQAALGAGARVRTQRAGGPVQWQGTEQPRVCRP